MFGTLPNPDRGTPGAIEDAHAVAVAGHARIVIGESIAAFRIARTCVDYSAEGSRASLIDHIERLAEIGLRIARRIAAQGVGTPNN